MQLRFYKAKGVYVGILQEISCYDGIQEINFSNKYLEFKACNPNTGETTHKHVNFSDFDEIRISQEE